MSTLKSKSGVHKSITKKSNLSRSRSVASHTSRVSKKSAVSVKSKKCVGALKKIHKRSILKSPSLQDGCFLTEKKSRNANYKSMSHNLIKRRASNNHCSLQELQESKDFIDQRSYSPKILNRSV